MAFSPTSTVRELSDDLFSESSTQRDAFAPGQGTETDELIEDGLAMQAEIERYRTQPASTFRRLEDFVAELGDD